MADLNRRQFLDGTTRTAAALAVAAEIETAAAADANARALFQSDWKNRCDAVWPGAEYWPAPQQDWRVSSGRLECINPALGRHVHLLTHELKSQPGELRVSVILGRIADDSSPANKGSAGFSIGIQGALDDFRHRLIYGKGLDAGLTASGGLFIGAMQSAKAGTIPPGLDSIELRMTAQPAGDGYRVSLAAHEPASGKLLAQVSQTNVPAERLVGNLALVANFGAPLRPAAKAAAKALPKTAAPQPEGAGASRWWFSDWRASGSKLGYHPERAFGPILFSQYTLSGDVLKLSAQMPPLGKDDSQTVALQLKQDGQWKTVADEPIHAAARLALFRITPWNSSSDVPYRLVYQLKDKSGETSEHDWTGTIRRDPIDAPTLSVADISCNTHAAFPNAQYVANVAKLDPDLLAFVGDQFYESSGGFAVTRAPQDAAILDYLRKWYLHGWTWRDLMRDRPSVSLPDDHDVYQGNLWGEAGGPKQREQAMGGYDMPPGWINVVHFTQTAHHPDAYERGPCQRGIFQYFGPLTYGRISFAILADRQYKSGPEGKVPPTGGRGDHVTDPNYDPKSADLAGLELLGEGQLKFLREWAADWRGAEMKAVISQTIFTAMATTHGGARDRLVADYDANGWPQTARNAALREIRKAFAVHIAGDQHLPALVHYGIDEHRDAGVAFAGPAVNVGYPRWWEPARPGENRPPGGSELTGDFRDHFGNPLTVLAVANGLAEPRSGLHESLIDKASGLGLVRFDKRKQEITIECWPFLADPILPGTQFPGWPVTIKMTDNYQRRPAAHLPELKVKGHDRPVVQVVSEASGEIVYTLRLAGAAFRPPVFEPGSYTIHVSEPETERVATRSGVVAAKNNEQTLEITL